MKTIILFMMIITTQLLADNFQWPSGHHCAVSLTFDDNLNSQLDIGVPMFDKAGISATFYSLGNAESLSSRMNEWRIIAANGHELGNHTLFHPCLEKTRGEKRTWLAEHTKLENYTIERIVDELKVANTLLHAIDGKTERTFAYTCCDTQVGKNKSFISAIDSLFPGARGIGGVPGNMRQVNVMNVESIAINGHTGEQLVDYVIDAEKKGTMVIFLFHGIDEGHLPVATEDLQFLIDYLSEHRDTIWTDTFLNIIKHVNLERARLGWK